METVEIPRRDWSRRLDEFTAVHEGWLVSIDVLGPELGALPEVHDLPLLGVSMDREARDSAVDIAVARSATDHLTHVIHGVGRMYVERTDQDADAALEFESADGTRTILRLRSALPPESVDGLPHKQM